MPNQQDRVRGCEPTKDDDHYIILVQDIPRHCRWQELKDMTRSLGGEQSLKAEVFDVGDGTQLGHCTIKGKSAAEQVFAKFCSQGWNGQRVRVKLVALDKSGNLQRLEGPRETNGVTQFGKPIQSPLPPPAVQGGCVIMEHNDHCASYDHSARQLAVTAASFGNAHYIAKPSQSVPPGAIPCHTDRSSARHIFPGRMCPPQPPCRSSSVAMSAPSITHYVATYAPGRSPGSSSSAAPSSSHAKAIPVKHINDGSTISISGLPPNQSESELRGILKRFGTVVYLEIHPDSRNPGKGKGTARARYESTTQALNAVRDLEGRYLGKHKLSVRTAKDEALTGSGANKAPPQESKTLVRESKSRSTQAYSKSVASPQVTASKKPKPAAATHRPPTARPSFLTTVSSSSNTSASQKRRRAAKSPPSPTGPVIVNGARHSSNRTARDSWAGPSGDDSDDSDDDSGGRELESDFLESSRSSDAGITADAR